MAQIVTTPNKTTEDSNKHLEEQSKDVLANSSTGVSTIEDKPEPIGAMEKFLQVAHSPNVSRSQFSPEKNAEIDQLQNSYNLILHDAIQNVKNSQALHVLGGAGAVPENKEAVTMNTQQMRHGIANLTGISEDRRIQLGRALQAVEKIQGKGLTIMKAAGSERYWIESTENGKKVYAVNAIQEVRELLDMFNKSPESEKEKEGNDKGSKLIDDGATDEQVQEIKDNMVPEDIPEWTTANSYHLAELGTDLLSSFAAMGAKATGIGAIPGAAVNIGGGLMATAFGAAGDYHAGASTGDIIKNVGVRLGLEAVEVFALAPVSLAGKFSKASGTGKMIRKAVNIAMLGGMIDATARAEWQKLFSKEDWGLDEYRTAAMLTQSLIGVMSGRGTRKRDALTLKKTKATTKAPVVKKDVKKRETSLIAHKKQLEGTAGYKKIGTDAKKNIAASNKKRTGEYKTALVAKKGNRQKVGAEHKKGLAAINKKYAPKPGRKPKGYDPKQQNIFKQEDLKNLKKQTKAKIKKVEDTYDTTRDKIKADNIKRKKAITKKQSTDEGLLKRERASKLIAKRKSRIAETTAKRKKILKTEKKQVREVHGAIGGKRVIKKGLGKGAVKAPKAAPKLKAKKSESEKKIAGFKKNKKDLENQIKAQPKTANNEAGVATKTQKKALEKLETSIKTETKKSKKLVPKSKSLIKKGLGKLKGSAKKGKDATAGLVRKAGSVTEFIAPRNGRAGRAMIKAALTTDVIRGSKYDYDMTEKEVIAEFKRRKFTKEQMEEFTITELRRSLKGMRTKEARAKTVNLKPRNEKKRDGGRFVNGPLYYNNSGRVIKAQTGTAKGQGDWWSNFWSGFGDYLTKPIEEGGVNLDTSPAGQKRMIKARSNFQRKDWQEAEEARLYRERQAAAEAQQSAENPYGAGTVLRNPEVPAWDYSTLLHPVVTEKLDPVVADPNKNPADTTPVDPTAKQVDTLEITALEKEELKKARNEAEAKAIRDKYDQLRSDLAGMKVADPTKFERMMGMFKNIKPSDLFTKHKIFEEASPYRNIEAPVAQAGSITNLPGLSAYMSQINQSPRQKSSDPTMSGELARRYHNQAAHQKQRLVAENAKFQQGRRDQARDIKNANQAGAINAMNINSQEINRRNLQFAQQRVANLAAKHQKQQQQQGRIMNQFAGNAQEFITANQNRKLADMYTDVVKKKSVWDMDYATRFKQAMEVDKDPLKAKSIKNEFMETEGYNPENFESDIASINTRYTKREVT